MTTPLYNQITEYATTSNPYFTPAFIDAKCYECSTSNNPQVMTVACDICKTLTVNKVIQLDFLDIFALCTPIIIIFIMIFLFRKKKKNKSII